MKVGDRVKFQHQDVVSDVTAKFGRVTVIRAGHGFYHILVDGIMRHPKCSAEAVIRGLSHYLQYEGTTDL